MWVLKDVFDLVLEFHPISLALQASPQHSPPTAQWTAGASLGSNRGLKKTYRHAVSEGADVDKYVQETCASGTVSKPHEIMFISVFILPMLQYEYVWMHEPDCATAGGRCPGLAQVRDIRDVN